LCMKLPASMWRNERPPPIAKRDTVTILCRKI
jgi:hypothetical protein